MEVALNPRAGTTQSLRQPLFWEEFSEAQKAVWLGICVVVVHKGVAHM